MTENDYIAEYVKEKRPEIIHTFDFISWKMVKICSNAVQAFVNAFRDIPSDEMVKLLEENEREEDNEDEYDGLE